ncbi:hypothetical protein [Peribacillus simplex]|uniref:hypothetical protein n=1 Tax=Peribacillus simplex TaxID=1478 RepID=UPI003D277F7B
MSMNYESQTLVQAMETRVGQDKDLKEQLMKLKKDLRASFIWMMSCRGKARGHAPFLAGGLENANRNSKEMVTAQKNDLKIIFAEIDDIISYPLFPMTWSLITSKKPKRNGPKRLTK